MTVETTLLLVTFPLLLAIALVALVVFLQLSHRKRLARMDEKLDIVANEQWRHQKNDPAHRGRHDDPGVEADRDA